VEEIRKAYRKSERNWNLDLTQKKREIGGIPKIIAKNGSQSNSYTAPNNPN
jgi:hypothetical protein